MVWCGNYSHRNSLSDGISCLNCKFIKQRDRAIDKTATKNSWDVKPNWRWKRKKTRIKYEESLKYWGAKATTPATATRTAKKAIGLKAKQLSDFRPWKMVSVSVRYLLNQPMDKKMKTWTLRFPARENRNMEKTLFDWPMVLQYDVKANYRLISRKFSGLTFFHQSVRLTNQKPRAFVSVR